MSAMNTNSALIIPPSKSGNTSTQLVFHPEAKPPIAIPDYFWLWFALGACILAAVAFFLWKKRHSKVPTIIIPKIPPHVRARRKLEEALFHISDPKLFSTLVSEAIRVYLEDRFQFHAPDRTTEEFLIELQETSILTEEQKQSLADFLSSCDLIKFAKFEPTEVELRGMHESALRLVNETEPTEAPMQTDSAQPAVEPTVPVQK